MVHPAPLPLPSRFLISLGAAAALLLPLLLAPAVLEAQNSRGFAFGRPMVTLGVHGGYGLALGGSDLFTDTRELLTVGARDLDGPALRTELSVTLGERWDLSLGLAYTRGETRSEFRDWVDQDELPIEQTTTFSRIPITVGARYFLSDRGRQVGQFAWIPAPWAPYVAAGAGVVRYSFEQVGDWVDTETLAVFNDELLADGHAPVVYLAGGIEMALGPHLALNTEGRYFRGRGDPGSDFLGFEPIDLSGLQATVGLSLRF